MSIVNKLLAIPNYYRTINPSTLSGSCDIIVIRDSSNVLRCTNFHIRFGKKHIFRLKECNITMFVNEEHCPLNLKLGKRGEVLFETETEEVVATKCSFESDAQIFKKYNLDITRKVVKNKEMANVKLVNVIGKMTVKENSNSPKSDTSVGNNEKHFSSSEEALGSSSNEFKEFYSHKNSRLGNYRKENTNEQSPRQISQVKDIKTTNLLPKSSSETNKDAKSTACDECPDSSSISEINNKKPELQRTPMEKEELTYIRYKYREKRMFLYRKKYFDYSENSKRQKTFYNIFRSTEHCEYITKTHAKLYSLLSGLINPRPKQDSDSACCENKRCCLKNCQATENTGCVGSLLSFSLCLKTKIENGDFTKTFENFRSRSLENYNNLVVRIEGCKMCKIEYFLPFELFTEFFFYLRTLMFSENSSRNRKFMEYVQKRIFECYNYTSPKKEAHEYSTTLSDNQLKKLKLKDGRNTLLFKIDGTSQQLYADCFLWNDDVRLIVSDIDGTITKSDAWGHVYTMMGKDWTHNGVAELFTKITRNTYKIIYLSSRPFSQIDYTKKYLFNISQNGYKLPVGPVLLSPNGIFGAIYREIILRNPQKFKIACLLDVRNLFKHNPFVSGFGNRKTDIITYYTLGIPKGKIFIIDPKGRLCEDRIEKKNYETLNALVENVFPPIKQSCYVNNEVQWWMFSTKK